MERREICMMGVSGGEEWLVFGGGVEISGRKRVEKDDNVQKYIGGDERLDSVEGMCGRRRRRNT